MPLYEAGIKQLSLQMQLNTPSTLPAWRHRADARIDAYECVMHEATRQADLHRLEDVDEEGSLDEGAFTSHHSLEGLHVCTDRRY